MRPAPSGQRMLECRHGWHRRDWRRGGTAVVGTRLAPRQIARETGVRLDGTLYAGMLAAPGGLVTSCPGMFKWNTRQMPKAFTAG